MKKINKYKIGEIVTCIKIDNTNDHLISVGKDYKVLEIMLGAISIMTDAGVICYISYGSFFISKRVLRMNKINKINKLNEIFCQSK